MSNPNQIDVPEHHNHPQLRTAPGGSHHPHPHEDGRRDHGHEHGAEGHAHGAHGHEHPGGFRGLLTSIFAPHSHDAADSVDDALESSRDGIRAVKISLLILGLTAVLQLVIVLLTGSVALLADTIHNFSDALTAVPLWIAFVLGRKAATRRYTYGFGRAEDLAGLFVVAMITLSAVLSGFESVRRLIDPVPISNPWMVLTAGVLGFVGNEWVALYRIRVGRRIGSAALVADGLHARTDGFTSLAVAVGAVGVMLGVPLADPIVGILITVAILVILRGAVVEVFRRLMDGVDPELVDTAEEVLGASPGVASVRRLRMRWDGHRLTAAADVEADPTLTLAAAEHLAHRTAHRLTEAVPKLVVADIRVAPQRQQQFAHD
jgi:cation diffusion facilitator family transporter